MHHKICLLVAYHKNHPTLKLSKKYFDPIHVGKSNSNVELPIKGDNTGENISSKNSNYAELTALYWAWKNVDADFYGLMHYRRYFYPKDDSTFFRKQKNKLKKVFNSKENFIDSEIQACVENIENKFGALNNFFQAYVAENTIFVPKKHKFYKKGIKTQYARFQHAEDWEIVSQIISEKYPQYKKTWKNFENQKWMYAFNMFLMSKNIFNAYAEWLFDVLGEVEKKSNIDEKEAAQSRVCGFISERLFNFYLLILQETNPDITIIELDVVKID